jgi:bisphosphoglycerate-independent phosphoglycerate mutase (AlkP superfamily)
MIEELDIKNRSFVILIILDGWGINQPYMGNAITQVKYTL